MYFSKNDTDTRLKPVIGICGATGCGKSKLAIQIAQQFNGEVVNVDALQLYKGLDIATNKVTLDEMQGVPHHLLSVLNPLDGLTFNIHKYREECLHIIKEIRSLDVQYPKMPVLVGGTHYYLESIFWKGFLQDRMETSTLQTSSCGHIKNPEVTDESLQNKLWPMKLLKQLPRDASDYYAVLRSLNPALAGTLHPNNTRKLRNALLLTLAKTASGGEQSQPCPRDQTPRFRDPDSLFLWLDCSEDILKRRLDARIEQMLDKGLIQEIDTFLEAIALSMPHQICQTSACLSNKYNVSGPSEDDKEVIFKIANHGIFPALCDQGGYRGVLQAIGFKEFEDFLLLDKESRNSKEGQLLLRKSVENMKVATRQYARRQTRWILNRFLRCNSENAIPVYRIEVSTALEALETESPTIAESVWTESVLNPVLRIIHQSLPPSLKRESHLIIPPGVCQAPESQRSPVERSKILPALEGNRPGPPFVCASCSGRIFITHQEWLAHIQSRKHKKRLQSLRNKATLSSSSTVQLKMPN